MSEYVKLWLAKGLAEVLTFFGVAALILVSVVAYGMYREWQNRRSRRRP